MKALISYILVACCWLNVASAAEKLEVGPAPNWVIPSTVPKSASGSSSADVAFLLEDRQLHFSKDADEVFVDSVVRIQSPQGLNALGTLTLMWNPDTMTVIVHKVHILRGEQVIDVLATQSFTVLRRERNLEYAVLDGVLTAAVQPTGLQIGDAIELSYSVKRSDPVMRGISEWLAGGFPNMPIAHARVRAVWGAGNPVRWKASESLPGMQEQHKGDQTEVTVELVDVQPLVQPKGAPTRFAQVREVEFSGSKSWSEISRRLAPLYQQAARIPETSPLQMEIVRIRAASPDPETRAAAALGLVQDQVRYVFLGMNDGGLVPAAADVTWTRRFGDCKAKTALLLALLQGVGIDARAVVVSSTRGDGLDTKLPMIGWFDHVLVQAQIAGKSHFLDGTRSGDRRLADLPDFGFHWGLPLTTKGSELLAIPVKPFDQPDNAVAIRIDASAGIHVPAPMHAELTVHGDVARAFKYGLANATASELDRRLRDYWKKQYDFVEVGSVAQSFDDLGGTERWTMDGTARLDWDGGTYETDGLGLGYKADLERPEGPHRDAPYAVAFPSYSQVTEAVVLPYHGKGFSVDGVDIDQTVGGIEYRRHATLDEGVFTATATSRAVAAEFPQSEAASVQQALRDMAKRTLRIRSPAAYVDTKLDKATRLAKTPTTASEYVDRGNQLMDDGKYDSAIADYTQALTLDAKDDWALADRGLAEARSHKTDLATKDLDAALALNPKNQVVYRGRGMLAMNSQHLKEAVEAFTKSLELEPDSAFALGKRAEVYSRLDMKDKARADAAEASRLDPAYLRMYELRASLLTYDQKFDQAVEVANAETTANPDAAAAWVGAAWIYESAHHHTEARHALDRALELEPQERTYFLRARVRPLTDRAGRRADLQEALKINPTFKPAQQMLVREMFLAHQYPEEIAMLGGILKLDQKHKSVGKKAIDEEDGDLLLQRGIAYLKSGQLDAGKKDISGVYDQAQTGQAFNGICWALAIAEVQLETALKSCDEALAKSAGHAAYNDSRGFVLLRMARFEESIAEYDRALTIDPTLSASLYGRGIAKHRKGDKSGGDADIEVALKAYPELADEFEEYGVQP